MVYKKIAMIFASILFLATNAGAEDPIVEHLKASGNDLEFLGQVHGLSSYLLRRGDKNEIIYITPDGSGVLRGQLQNREGNVTKWQLLDYAKRTAETKRLEPRGELAPLHLGTAGPTLVVFASPTCGHCRSFWQSVGPNIVNGLLQVIIYPVPSGSDDKSLAMSREITLRLLSAHEPEIALLKYTLGDLSVKPEVVASSAERRLEENIKLFQQFEFTGTPAFVVQKGPSVVVKAEGWPIDLRNLLPKYNPHS